ncbi:MAG TPA: ABC transporter permease, partial [Fimbriimonadaceae bacterium]|nr:ABC transporter permease [Fimbriimonadaceae bacterium]
MAKRLASYGAVLRAQEAGLVLVIVALTIIISSFAGTYVDKATGHSVNTFLNPRSLLQVTSDSSLFAIMAVGSTIVIISGGIDLSVGSIYALAAVLTALFMRHNTTSGFWLPLVMCVGIGIVCGALNGIMVSALKVHPFIITLGTMWAFRGVSFVISKAESILFPDAAIKAVQSSLGLQTGLYPIPTIVMVLVTIGGWIYLSKTTAGRNVYAFGGNEEASRYTGIKVNRVQIGVFVISGLSAGIAAFIGSSFYGAASCADATGYELKVIAAAVVGGASLTGGKGGALGALLG